ncbi:MAG: FprA family A-type flavoprotein [Bacillota bacterium]
MRPVELVKGVYWVGAVDWNARYFHGPALTTHRGTTYNAYLIVDEKVALVDTVYLPFCEELIENISRIIDPAKIDYVVINHTESDHAGSFAEIMKLVSPGTKVLCTQKGAEGLTARFPGEWNLQVVKTGDSVSLGKKTLTFVEAPMLHWPDSMFTYVQEDALLLPNDAFGQHIATSFHFDDEVEIEQVMEEAAKYYANILLPFSDLVLKKLEAVGKMGIDIKMIAPSHGIIWRKDPGRIIDAYVRWAKGEAENKAVIVYDTMWESTAKMARALLDGLASQGVNVKLFRASVSDRNDIIKEMINAKAILVGSPTINNDILAALSAFLDDLRGLKPKNKIGLAFGSYGWGGGAVKTIEERLTAAKVALFAPGLQSKWLPDEHHLAECYEMGKKIGVAITRS